MKSEINSSNAKNNRVAKVIARSGLCSRREAERLIMNGKVKVNNKIDSVAYMQVKDLTKSQNDQVFIFNGWTFASDPSLTPFDHAIYDLQLLKCNET